MIEIIVSDKKKYYLPESWNELTYEQIFKNAVSIFEYNIVKDEATKSYLRTRIINALSGLEPDANNTFLLGEITRKVLPEMDWMFSSNRLTEQKLPSIMLRKRFALCRFYGPASDFANLTFEEFDDAEFWFHALINPDTTEREKAMNMLCAILYRQFAETPGDSRIPYNAFENEIRQKWFNSADTRAKLYVLLWYMGCRTVMVESFGELFNGKGSGEGNWTLLAHQLSGPVLGTLDQVNKRPVRVVLTEMLRLYRQGQNTEAAQENAQIFG